VLHSPKLQKIIKTHYFGSSRSFMIQSHYCWHP